MRMHLHLNGGLLRFARTGADRSADCGGGQRSCATQLHRGFLVLSASGCPPLPDGSHPQQIAQGGWFVSCRRLGRVVHRLTEAAHKVVPLRRALHQHAATILVVNLAAAQVELAQAVQGPRDRRPGDIEREARPARCATPRGDGGSGAQRAGERLDPARRGARGRRWPPPGGRSAGRAREGGRLMRRGPRRLKPEGGWRSRTTHPGGYLALKARSEHLKYIDINFCHML